jgi:hypothetical protein
LGNSEAPVVTVHWPSGITDELSMTSNSLNTLVEGAEPVNVTSASQENSIQIFPNPATESFTLNHKTSNSSQVFMYDTTGRLVYSKNYAGGMLLIEKGNLNPGTYHLQIIPDNSPPSNSIVIFH